MKFNKFKQRYYDNVSDKWKTLRMYHLRIDSGDYSTVFTLTLPEATYDNAWFILPTVTYRHEPAILPGPSFTLQFKWLKWCLLSLKAASYPKSTLDEDETDAPETYLDQETWNKKENS